MLTISSCSSKSSLSITLISGFNFSFNLLPSFRGRMKRSLMCARSICIVSFSCLMTSKACRGIQTKALSFTLLSYSPWGEKTWKNIVSSLLISYFQPYMTFVLLRIVLLSILLISKTNMAGQSSIQSNGAGEKTSCFFRVKNCIASMRSTAVINTASKHCQNSFYTGLPFKIIQKVEVVQNAVVCLFA